MVGELMVDGRELMRAAYGNVAGVRPSPEVRNRYSKAPRGEFDRPEERDLPGRCRPDGAGVPLWGHGCYKDSAPNGAAATVRASSPAGVTPRPVFRTPWFKTSSA